MLTIILFCCTVYNSRSIPAPTYYLCLSRMFEFLIGSCVAQYLRPDCLEYSYVIIGQFWENYLGDKLIDTLGDARSAKLSKIRFSKALDRGLKIISDSGAIPILIKATPTPPRNTHHCVYQHIKSHQMYDPTQCDFNLTQNKNILWLNKLFNQMQGKYPQLIVIDPKEIQCTNGVCAAALNGVPVYRDPGHITDYASYYFGRMYLEKYNNPLIGVS